MSENKEFLANFIADFQSKNQQKFVEMRSESPELLSAIENVLGFLKGKYELDTDIELVPESAIPKPVVEPTAPIQESKIRVDVISLKIVSNDGQTETLDSSYWTNSQIWLDFCIDKFGINNIYTIDVDILWKNQFIFRMSVTIDDWFRSIRDGLGKWVHVLLSVGINGNSQLINQAFKNYNELAFEDTLQTTTQSASTNVGEIPVLQINVDVDWVNGDLFTERFAKWEDANDFLRDNFRSAGGYTGIKRIYLDIRWGNGFVLKYALTTAAWISEIQTNFSQFLRKKIQSLALGNREKNQTFNEFDKLQFEDANVSQTQNVKTSKPQPTLVNIQPTGNEIELKSFVFTLEDSQKGLIEADGVLWSELNDIFLKSFERNTFQKLTIDVEWEDGFLIVETIYFDDIDAVEMLENTTSIGTFIYKNWDLFTTTQAKSRGNYAFLDSTVTVTTPVATQATTTTQSVNKSITALDFISCYFKFRNTSKNTSFKTSQSFDNAAELIQNAMQTNSELVELNIVVLWENNADVEIILDRPNGIDYSHLVSLLRNEEKNPSALVSLVRTKFSQKYPLSDMDNYEGLKITGQSSATITTPVATEAPPTPPAKRGRPKKVSISSQPSTATISTPKVKKKIDEVKTADDLLDLDLDDLEI